MSFSRKRTRRLLLSVVASLTLSALSACSGGPTSRRLAETPPPTTTGQPSSAISSTSTASAAGSTSATLAPHSSVSPTRSAASITSPAASGRSPAQTSAPRSPAPSSSRRPTTTYDIAISPDPAVAEQEVRIEVVARGDYSFPQITRIDFGDGTQHTCYYHRNGYSEDCEVYGGSARRTQHCYHVYQRPGRYTIQVRGTPDGVAFAHGQLTIDVVASPIPGPTLGTPRSC